MRWLQNSDGSDSKRTEKFFLFILSVIVFNYYFSSVISSICLALYLRLTVLIHNTVYTVLAQSRIVMYMLGRESTILLHYYFTHNNATAIAIINMQRSNVFIILFNFVPTKIM